MSNEQTPREQFDAAMQKVAVELTYLARNQNDNHDEAVYDAIRNLAHAVNLLATNATWSRSIPVYNRHPMSHCPQCNSPLSVADTVLDKWKCQQCGLQWTPSGHPYGEEETDA